MIDLPRLFAVLGHPIGHSRSPAMHAAAFAAMGEPHRYLAFDVHPRDLGPALRGVGALGLGGVNLTVPHKQAAVSMMDRLTADVRRIGALNTIVIGERGLEGHSTDGHGFLRGLSELGDVGAPRRVAVVLGGGGAARCVVDALLHASPPFEVRWVSRRPEALPDWTGVQPVSWSGLAEALAGAGVLVQATTVGMPGGPADFPTPVVLDGVDPQLRVVDLVYPRPEAGLLDAAARRGLAHQDGLPMLLWQGVRAQELWRGTALPPAAIEAMRAALAPS